MTARAPLGPLLRAFFADHLVQQKAASPQPSTPTATLSACCSRFSISTVTGSQRRSPWTTSTLP